MPWVAKKEKSAPESQKRSWPRRGITGNLRIYPKRTNHPQRNQARRDEILFIGKSEFPSPATLRGGTPEEED